MGSYKSVTQSGTLSGVISDAISELTSLGEECREIVENASEGLSQTQRIQTLDETASALEDVQEPDMPEFVSEFTVTYYIQVNTRKRASPSRAVRCSNAVSMLEAAKSSAEEKMEELQEAIDARPDDDEGDADDEVIENKDALETLISEFDDIISACESLEFPGMFG